jgi:hypothetical protein
MQPGNDRQYQNPTGPHDIRPEPLYGEQRDTGKNAAYPDEYPYAHDEGDESSGPGCFIWGVMLVFTLLFGVFVVLLAALGGWTEGLRTAQGHATATRGADIAIQCERIGADIANGSMGLVQARMENIMPVTPAVECVAAYMPSATALYMESLPTNTPTATNTPPPTLTPTATHTPAAQIRASQPPPIAAATESQYDLTGLLAEARGLIQADDNLAAIDTLEAIQAIDANFQKSAVDSLLFQALTSEARDLFLRGENRAEAILLTERAKEYGDVGELQFEAYIAQLYLDAQVFRGINYNETIRLLSEITRLAPNYFDVQTQLFNERVAYGDALVAGFEHCRALEQYNVALQLRQAPNVAAKRDQATINCPSTNPQPGVTPGADQGAPGEQQPIAPIGVPGT